MWALWWIWAIAAVALATLEVIVPVFLFLGFAVGAGIVGLLLLIGGPIGGALAGSLPLTALIFAVASLASWLVLRRMMGVRKGQVKVWDRDINED